MPFVSIVTIAFSTHLFTSMTAQQIQSLITQWDFQDLTVHLFSDHFIKVATLVNSFADLIHFKFVEFLL